MSFVFVFDFFDSAPHVPKNIQEQANDHNVINEKIRDCVKSLHTGKQIKIHSLYSDRAMFIAHRIKEVFLSEKMQMLANKIEIIHEENETTIKHKP